jgi:hypothetical protein
MHEKSVLRDAFFRKQKTEDRGQKRAKRGALRGTMPRERKRRSAAVPAARFPAAASFNQDGGFSFFRAKERESPQKRERKPRASDTAKAPSYFAYRDNQPQPIMPTGRPCTFRSRVWFPTLRTFLKRYMPPQSAAQGLAVLET